MSRRFCFSLLLGCLTMSGIVTAQDSTASKKALVPVTPNMLVSLENVCVAKSTGDKKSIQIAKPTFRIESKIVTVKKTVYQTETRSRTVNKNGNESTEDYTVQVPVTVMEEVIVESKIPNGTSKVSVPLERLRGWGIVGNAIAPAELVERLSTTSHVFVLERNIGQPLEAMDPFYRNVLNPNATILVVPPNTFPLPASAPVPTPDAPPAAPAPVPGPKS